MGAEVWQTTILGELGSFRNGANFSRQQEGRGLPVLKVKDFGNETFVPDGDQLDELDDDLFNLTEALTLSPGDTVVIRSNGNRAMVGRSLFFRGASQPTTFSGFCIRFRPDPRKVEPRFAAYFIRSPQCRRRFTAYGSGTSIQNINQAILANIPIALPPLPEQRRIASVLGALDDKIELNRRMNETLEAMARALFKSWFVDFDPVCAKMEGRQPYGMDVDTAALFPDSFEDSELGPIPKGWRLTAVGRHVSLQRGKTYKSKLLGEPGPYLLGLASIQREGGFRRDKLRTYGGDSDERLILGPGDVYVSLKDVTQAGYLLGAVARVPPDVEAGRVTQDTVKLCREDGALPLEFLYRVFRTDHYRWFCRSRAIGTTNLSLARDDFLSYLVVTPPKDIVSRFLSFSELMTARQHTCMAESKTLVALRDTLLPKLLSGELRVPEAEEMVEAS